MKRSEVIDWLKSNGGQKGMPTVDYIPYKRPNPLPGEPDITAQRKKVTWTASNGQVLSVYDDSSEDTPGPWASAATSAEGVVGDPDYEVIGGGDNPDDKVKDTRSTEQKANDAELDRQRRANSNPNINDPRWETDAERDKRGADRIATQRQQGIDAQNANNQSTQNRIADENLQIAKDREKREAEDAVRRGTATDRQLAIAEAGNAREQDKYERDKNKPQYLSPVNEEAEAIAQYDPSTGQVVAIDNPIYNAAKAAAKRKTEELTTAIAMNRETRESAAAEYTRWYKENIELPFAQMQERRAQTADTRAAQQAEEQRKQFAASQEMDKAKIGQQAAGQALDFESSLNPYRVGSQFGSQMSSAINGLAAGGKVDGPSAAAGVNFTADAFQYKKPNLDAIATKAAANAVKHLTTYRPDQTPVATTDYSGIPTSGGTVPPPAAPTPIDTGAIWNNTYQPPMQPPGQENAPA